MTCCPENLWGSFKRDHEYQDRGIVEQVDDLLVYRVEPEKNLDHGGRCVIWNYHIFGFNGGRARQLCDLIASKGYMVVIPDYFRGTFMDPRSPAAKEFIIRHTQWDNLQKDWNDKVKLYAKKHGAKSFITIGTCWGSYMALRLSGINEVRGAISIHPAHSKIVQVLGEDETELLKAVKCPQLFLPAQNDHDNVKEGGLSKQMLGDKLRIVEFPDMIHGWTVRGDTADGLVNRDVKKALDEVIAFLKLHF